MKKQLLLFLLMVLSFGVLGAEKEAKYIFLFIGDGMGNEHVDYMRQVHKYKNQAPLIMDSFPAVGITHTNCAENITTDSAASGSAIACGQKTTNGRLGLDTEGKPMESSAILAAKLGRKVGIISNVGVNHATPAAFYAHNLNRDSYDEIADEIIEHQIDFMGGGNIIEQTPGKAKQVIQKLESEKNYTFASGRDALLNLTVDNLPALATNYHTYNIDQPSGEGQVTPTLSEYTAKAVELLKNDKGFFIMTEGGRIDHCGHANDIAALVYEMDDFDKAIQVAYDFYKANPDETLIVVTADHNTGGLQFLRPLEELDMIALLGQKGTWFAILDEMNKDTEDFDRSIQLLSDRGGMKLTDADKANLRKILASAPANRRCSFAMGTVHQYQNERTGITWRGDDHFDFPITTRAIGVGSEKFNGEYENSDVGLKIKEIMTQK